MLFSQIHSPLGDSNSEQYHEILDLEMALEGSDSCRPIWQCYSTHTRFPPYSCDNFCSGHQRSKHLVARLCISQVDDPRAANLNSVPFNEGTTINIVHPH